MELLITCHHNCIYKDTTRNVYCTHDEHEITPNGNCKHFETGDVNETSYMWE